MAESRKKKFYEIEIMQLVFGGDGMARLPDGRAVFVPFTLPGERIRISLVEEKKSFARGQIEEILIESPLRVAPRCIHFGFCGGCQYQHMDYEEQVRFKQAIYREQIERIAGFQDTPVFPIRPSPSAWNYRNTVQFHLSPNGVPGYYAAGSHQVVEIKECYLPQPGINEVWPNLDFEPGSPVQRVEIVEGTDAEILIALEGEGELPEMAIDIPVSVVYLLPEGNLILAGNNHMLMQINERIFSVSAGSFFQVNTGMIPVMIDVLLSNLDLTGKPLVMDLYSGVGLFSAFLAPHAGKIIAVEESETACQDFTINLDLYDHVELYQGDVKQVLPGIHVKPDIMVVDPPRSGLDRNVLDQIVKLAPSQLAYFSCDPSTLARDLKRLVKGGFHLEKMIPFDLFPQTYHIESLSILNKQSTD